MKVYRTMAAVLVLLSVLLLSLTVGTAAESVTAAGTTTDVTEATAETDTETGALVYDGDTLVKADPQMIGETCTIRKGTRTIAAQAFRGCKKLQHIDIPYSVESIGKDAFVDTAFYNESDNWKNGMLIVNGKYLIAVHSEVVECQIPYGTRVIADGVFKNCKAIQFIRVPVTIQEFCKPVWEGVTQETEVRYDGSLWRFMSRTDLDLGDFNLVTKELNMVFRILLVSAMIVFIQIIVLAVRNDNKECREKTKEEDA